MSLRPRPEFSLGEFSLFEFSLIGDERSAKFVVGAATSVEIAGAATASCRIGASAGAIAEFSGAATASAETHGQCASIPVFVAASTASSDFSSDGASSVALAASAAANMRVSADGSSAVESIGEAIAHARFSADGSTWCEWRGSFPSRAAFSAFSDSQVALVGGNAIKSVLQCAGKTAAMFGAGAGEPTAFSAHSQSGMVFYTTSSADPLVDIHSRSAVLFASGARASVTALSVGASVASFGLSAIYSAKCAGSAMATAVLSAQSCANSNASGSGQSGVAFRATPVRAGGLSINGASAFLPRGATVSPASFGASSMSSTSIMARATFLSRYTTLGKSAFSVQVQPKRVTSAVVESAGNAAMSLRTSKVTVVRLAAAGKSLASFYLGSPVYTYLPPAAVEMIRPFENRALIREFEQRQVTR